MSDYKNEPLEINYTRRMAESICSQLTHHKLHHKALEILGLVALMLVEELKCCNHDFEESDYSISGLWSDKDIPFTAKVLRCKKCGEFSL